MSKHNGDIVTFLKKKDYKMINDNLGRGSLGKTVLLQDPFIEEFFVAKMYQPMYEDIKEEFYANFLDEIKIMYKLNHPNIVRIYNYYAYEKEYTGYILMEYIDGKSIQTYFSEYTGIWESASLNEIFVQLIDGFDYIEKKGVIHRDIREGNILIDNNGVVKIIDFGIGKIFANSGSNDSLVEIVNRDGIDTLPKEYYESTYTSKTDMFYLAELFRRMLELVDKDINDFSYNDILEKMMRKNPEDRYEDFAEIKDSIIKRDFTTMSISEQDKVVYQNFTNSIYKDLSVFVEKRDFVTNPDTVIVKLETALELNLFESYIQNNSDVIDAIVCGRYRYKTRQDISCQVVRDFLVWYKGLSDNSRRLVLRNIISKLSLIDIEAGWDDLPFN